MMRLTFLGTGTSMGVPIIGCPCLVCTSADPRNQRLRTSALVEIMTWQHRLNLLIDAGPDFRAQALTNRLATLDALLLTHAHYDHVAGIDDLRPLAIQSGSHMPVYGSTATLDDVRTRFSYAFATAADGTTRPALDLHPIRHYEPFAINPLQIMPFDVQHGTRTITGYRFGRLGYVTDASDLPPATIDLLHDLDVLVINALRFQPHVNHYSLEQALAMIAELQPRQAFLVHLSHAFDHALVNQQLPPGVALAHDGLQVEITDA
jgi:phosphoribosyl 1,2-cyclic phosphate phosphodiesterase